MADKLYIRGIERQMKPGRTRTRLLSSTLDTALVIIPQVAEFDIEPMDEVTLGTQYALVASIRRKLATFTPVKLWNYEVGLISPVIKLQRIVVPNRSITQPITGTLKTIYQVMNEYRIIYASWLVFNQDLIDITTGVTAPELQWNQSTLFEMYNDLLSVVGCVITMTDFTHAGVLDLNARGSEIDQTKLNNMEASQSIEEYANELEIDAKNAVYPDMNIQTYERLVLKTTQSSILTVDNAELILAKDVFKIHKIDCQLVDEELYTADDIVKADITAYLAEKTVYNAYKTSNSLLVITAKDYKRNAIYYTEGSNIIGGFGYHDDAVLGINTRRAIINIMIDATGLVPIDLLAYQIFDMTFGVWYTSTEDIKFTVKKTVDNVTDSVLINNQETSHTDIRALVKKNQDTVNRIGNELVIIYGRYSDIADIPDLGDTMGDYVLTSQTVKYHLDGYEFSGELTKHYVMENMFTAIKNSIRYSAIQSSNKAFLSEHVNKYTIHASTLFGTNYVTFEQYLINFAKTGYYPKVIKANIVYGNNDSGEFLMNPSVHWLGNNTIRMNVRMPDNYSAGIRVEKKTIFYVADKYSVVDTPYVDSNGEFEALELLVYKDIINPDLTAYNSTLREAALDVARSYPLISEGLTLSPLNIIFDTNLLYRYKDNREITSETLQFYHTTDEGVGIGDAYYQNSALTYMGDTDIPLYVWVSTTELYEDGDQTAHGTNISGVVRISNGIRSTYTLAQWEALNVMSWAIADASGHIYFWVNGDARTVYLRSNYVYVDVTYELTGLVISSTLSSGYVKGNDYQLLDLVISSVLSQANTKGSEYQMLDLAVASSLSEFHEAGTDYFMNDLVVASVLSQAYTSTPDYQMSLEISSVLSMGYTGYAPDAYELTGLEISSVLSQSNTYLIPTGYTLSDLVIASSLGMAYSYVGWYSAGTTPSGTAVCTISSHIGNVKCDATVTGCTWFEDGEMYISSVDETYNETLTCEQAADKVECAFLAGQWYCQYYQTAPTYTYTNCQTCGVV